MALQQVDQYNQYPSLASGETIAYDSEGNALRGDCYTWLNTTTKQIYAIRMEWYIVKKGSEYYRIYFRTFLGIKKGWSLNFSGSYSVKYNSKSIQTNKSFSTGGLLKPTVGSKNAQGKETGYGYYLIADDSYTIYSAGSSTIGLNGTGYNINGMYFTVNFNGTTTSQGTFNNVNASKTGSPLHLLPPIVTATAATIDGLSVTGGFKKLSVLWSTDVSVSSVEYSINDGSTWNTVSSGSQGSFSITSLSPGTYYTVILKVTRDGLSTQKSDSDWTYDQPTISLSTTSVSIGINDTSKSITISTTNDHSYCYLRARVYLSNGVEIASVKNIGDSSGSVSIPLNISTIKNYVTDSSSFRVALETYTDSGYRNTAYSTVYTSYGTITMDLSASDITFDESDFIITSSTSGYQVSGGTLGDRLLIRSLSSLTVQIASLATTKAGTLTYTVEIKNSSDYVVKSQTLSGTTPVNIGALTSAGTYYAVLTINNVTYDTSKTVYIYNIYVSEYSKPSVYATVVKAGSAGSFLMTVSAQYSTIKNINGSNVNQLDNFYWQYKLATSSSWSYGGSLSSASFNLYGTTFQLDNYSQTISGYSSSSNYNFRFVIEDSLNSITYELNAAEAGSIIRILTNGQVGIGASPDTTDDEILLTIGKSAKADEFRAFSFTNISLAEEKDNIRLYDGDVQSIIQNTDVYSYNYKRDLNKDIKQDKIGFVIGEEYNTYEGIMNEKKNAIDLYSCIGVLWKSQQKIYEELAKIQNTLQSK